jgi:hypothetical protein
MSVSQNAPKAERARELVQQCRFALGELRNDPRVSWFVLWAGTLGLLRTIGDVLKNDVDIRVRKAHARWFDKLKHYNAIAGRGPKVPQDGGDWEPAIFWQFIRRDRNLLLHEAKLTVKQSVMLELTGVAAIASAAGEAPRPPLPPAPPPRPPMYSYTMSTPPYAGRDSRDVVEEAIQWWEEQIEDMERDAI